MILMIRKVHVGQSVHVFFDPRAPNASVLVPGTDALYLQALFDIGAVLAVSGFASMVVQIGRRRKRLLKES